MKKGKLKYYPKYGHWKIVDKKCTLHDPDPFYTSIAIKLYGMYINCIISYITENIIKKPGWYVQFLDATFALDKSQTYEIEYNIDEDLLCPF
ncbi:MAG TPA: hypothetical protein VJ881_09225 [Halanaerobiales bacterium]|nr:hypothetical protein [Halanaerobiales bacterium]